MVGLEVVVVVMVGAGGGAWGVLEVHTEHSSGGSLVASEESDGDECCPLMVDSWQHFTNQFAISFTR